MSTENKPFRLTYVEKATGNRVENERPRLMITADGKHKSLCVGQQTILCTVPIEESDDNMWATARAHVAAKIATY